MKRRKSAVPTLVPLLVFLLVIVILIRQQQTPPRPRQHSMAELPIPTMSGRDRAAERSRRRDSSTRSERARPRDQSCGDPEVTCSSEYFRQWQEPASSSCTPSTRRGYLIPDRRCTPGGIDRSVTVNVLRDSKWRTRCIRNCETSEQEKHVAYSWYGIQKPRGNSGDNQVCELDHLVPLELGGADGMGNIWPECGPNATVLENRYFKVKDRVENYLADEVRAGRVPLATAQRGIATDWTQYLSEANRYCESGGRC